MMGPKDPNSCCIAHDYHHQCKRERKRLGSRLPKFRRSATTLKEKAFKPNRWFIAFPLIKRFLDLRRVTQPCTIAFKYLPSSNSNTQKCDDLQIGMTSVPTALQDLARARTLLLCQTGGKIQYFLSSRLE